MFDRDRSAGTRSNPRFRSIRPGLAAATVIAAGSLSIATVIPASATTPARSESSTTRTTSESPTTSSSTRTSESTTERTSESEAEDNDAEQEEPITPFEPEYSDVPIDDIGKGIQQRMDKVTEQVAEDGGEIGLAFLDRATGELVCNSNCDESFSLASLSKIFVAEAVGYSNYTRPDGEEIKATIGDAPVAGNADAMLRDDMIRYSDNEATDFLWGNYGSTKIIDSAIKRYGLSDATIPNSDWGSTKASPRDIAQFLDGILSGEGGMNEAETSYFIRLLKSVPRYSYGDADQNIGLRAALPREEIGIKGGWYDPEIRTSAGFMGEDNRYIVVALASYVSPEEFTDAISGVFPTGAIPREDGAEPETSATSSAEPGQRTRVNWVGTLFISALCLGLGFLAGRAFTTATASA